MQSTAISAEDYINSLPDDRKRAMSKLRQSILSNLPNGFTESFASGMLNYVVPHSLYPPGYHCNPKQPLPFLALASQKNFIALYHMGIYSDPALLGWFTAEFPKHSRQKPDMGKSCIRFKKIDDIPYELIAELCRKVTVDEWIDTYETQIKRK